MQNLSDDLLHGASAIGEAMNTTSRRVYHLAQQRTIPVFHLGGKLCARRSTLLRHIEELESGEGLDRPT